VCVRWCGRATDGTYSNSDRSNRSSRSFGQSTQPVPSTSDMRDGKREYIPTVATSCKPTRPAPSTS